MWSVGCIFAEILKKQPMFVGTNEMTQLDNIFSVLGKDSVMSAPVVHLLLFTSVTPHMKPKVILYWHHHCSDVFT
jgi:hypothetical protein